MPLIKRLGYYLGGFAIGLIFLAIFLKNKAEETGSSFCYLPNCRVLKELRSKPLAITQASKASLQSAQWDSIQIAYILNEGAVDFSKSDTKNETCKTYHINAEVETKPAAMVFKNCKDSVYLESVRFDAVN
ncbi:hypothetical protein [Sediminicola luteus]|uniref:DUF4258 domain-containing protein n=1 Tax=Sediminicola luteus TaxID=319238 RepID=A0A2A4G7L0_9FLAO|nr:hypothetical protein [Sediminicola luteus]PCE63968.1 hypothetical protein B7P33_11990 [Sediminicola luteus]